MEGGLGLVTVCEDSRGFEGGGQHFLFWTYRASPWPPSATYMVSIREDYVQIREANASTTRGVDK